MRLSVIVCAYNMARELPRTLHTMSTSYQTGVEEGDYEIIVVDNGSAPPVDEHALRSIAGNVHVRTVQVPNRSPAPALNAAVAQARGEMIGLFIDGARMLSPGIFGMALDIHRFDRDCVVGTTAFHLGPDVQMVSVRNGYDQAAEDRLLETVPWKTDGYSLFGISVLAGSSRAGWFGCIAESNGVFMGRERWERIGGLDERFASPGGGFVNLEFWQRAVRSVDNRPWMLLGEGTFHQMHGGAATNGAEAIREAMHDEYRNLMGCDHVAPEYSARLFGSLDARLARRFIGG